MNVLGMFWAVFAILGCFCNFCNFWAIFAILAVFHKVTYEIVGVVNFLKISTFSLPIKSIFVKSIPKLFSIKYFTTLLL